MSNRYSLRVFDTELMRFSIERKDLGRPVIEVEYISPENEHLLPVGMETTPEGIWSWLNSRVIPKNRAFVHEILNTLGLNRNDVMGIIDVCKGLSLTDSYWVVPEGFAGTFAEYNLFENRFSEILALVAYTGAGQSDPAFSTSPELTTNGMLPKAWRYIEGEGIYLYKGGTSMASNAGREPSCELYASQVAKRMGLHAVEYELENWKGISASRCKLFTSPEVSFIPIYQFQHSVDIGTCLKMYEGMGPEAFEEFKSMLVFDALIWNEDRHFGNFGLLRFSRTGEIIGPAPIFDNGLSLLCMAGKDIMEDVDGLRRYASFRVPPYNSFEDVCKAVMGPVQKKQLRKMIGFRFEHDPLGRFSENHLHALEILLAERVEQLLKIPNATI